MTHKGSKCNLTINWIILNGNTSFATRVIDTQRLVFMELGSIVKICVTSIDPVDTNVSLSMKTNKLDMAPDCSVRQ